MTDLRIAIVDDHTLLAQSLAFALELEGYAVEVPPLGTPGALLARLVTSRPDLVLLDLELGDPVGDGLDFVRPLVERGIAVLVVTSTTERSRLARTVEHGALGFVSKTAPVERLLEAVGRAARGEPVLGPEERSRLLVDLHRQRRAEQVRLQAFDRLTPRERQVLHALTEGKTVQVIASEWVLAPSTVRSQVRGILTKLGVGCQLEAVGLASTNGWFRQSAAELEHAR